MFWTKCCNQKCKDKQKKNFLLQLQSSVQLVVHADVSTCPLRRVCECHRENKLNKNLVEYKNLVDCQRKAIVKLIFGNAYINDSRQLYCMICKAAHESEMSCVHVHD